MLPHGSASSCEGQTRPHPARPTSPSQAGAGLAAARAGNYGVPTPAGQGTVPVGAVRAPERSGTQRSAAPCPRPARSSSRAGAALRGCGSWAAAVEQLPAGSAPRAAQLPPGWGRRGEPRSRGALFSERRSPSPGSTSAAHPRPSFLCALRVGGRSAPLAEAVRRERRQRGGGRAEPPPGAWGGGAGELRHLQKGERGFRSRSRILPPAERSNG